MTTIASPRPLNRRKRQWRVVLATVAGLSAGVVVAVVWAFGPACWAYISYHPQEGDVLFQSLPRSPLVNAIEGATQSPYSHCGVVARREGRWVVYEAYGRVSATPLSTFVFRGRGQGFAVYRLKPPHQTHIAAMLEQTEKYLGRPYDVRYRMDDEKIYCSELIYKAYRDASGGEQLGRLVPLSDLQWKPFLPVIEHFEKGPVPLDRELITPRDMALAEQFDLVFAFGIETR